MGCASSHAPQPEFIVQAEPRVVKKDLSLEETLFEEKADFLRSVPLMRRLPEAKLPRMAEIMGSREYFPGDIVQHQGEIGREFHMIRSGEALVNLRHADGSVGEIRILSAHDYFGDVTEDVLPVEVVARTKLQTYVLAEKRIKQARLHKHIVTGNQRRNVISSLIQNEEPADSLPSFPKTDEEKAFLREVLFKSPFVNPLQVDEVMAIASQEVVEAGTAFLKEGDMTSDKIYIIQEGAFDCIAVDDELRGPADIEDDAARSNLVPTSKVPTWVHLEKKNTLLAKVDELLAQREELRVAMDEINAKWSSLDAELSEAKDALSEIPGVAAKDLLSLDCMLSSSAEFRLKLAAANGLGVQGGLKVEPSIAADNVRTTSPCASTAAGEDTPPLSSDSSRSDAELEAEDTPPMVFREPDGEDTPPFSPAASMWSFGETSTADTLTGKPALALPVAQRTKGLYPTKRESPAVERLSSISSGGSLMSPASSLSPFKTLGKGDMFGELSLLHKKQKGASVIATQKSVLWVINRRAFKTVLMQTSYLNTPALLKYLEKVSSLSHLYHEERAEVAKAMSQVVFRKGDCLLKQGTLADGLYILHEGKVAIMKNDHEEKKYTATAATSRLKIFGENALKMNEVQARTVKVISQKATVFFLARSHLEIVLGSMSVLQTNPPHADESRSVSLYADDSMTPSSSPSRRSPVKRQGDILEPKSPKSPGSRNLNLTLSPSRRAIKMAAGKLGGHSPTNQPTPSFFSVDTSFSMAPPLMGVEQAREGCCQGKVLQKDLKKLGVLGAGAFGSVGLWEHTRTGATYAMKTISKGFIQMSGAEFAIMNEKAIMMMTDSEFIVKLHETYSDGQRLSFLMEPCLGGELHDVYKRLSLYGSQPHAAYYVAGTALAFCHLHRLHVVHRDLKPENLVLNADGCVKLMDFGLAKICIGKTFTLCGTVEYMSPETIAFKGQDTGRDWWSLGILIFELMTGRTPFTASNGLEVCRKIREGFDVVAMPKKLKGPCHELLKELLKEDPAERLPMSAQGRETMKTNAWFQSIDWVALENGTMKPPYKPKVRSSRDLQNFKKVRADAPYMPYTDDGSRWDMGFASASE